MWAVKLRFLLIYENILKSNATASSECTTKHENKVSYNTDYNVPDLIDFFGNDWKEITTQGEKKEIFIFVKNIVQTFLLVFSMNFLNTKLKIYISGQLYVLLKPKAKLTTWIHSETRTWHDKNIQSTNLH